MSSIGWLLYNKEDLNRNREFVNWFLEEAKELKINLKLIVKEDLSFGVKDNMLSLTYKDESINPPVFAVVRNIDSLLSTQLELMGTKVFNNSSISFICNNKARTHQYLAGMGIPMMDTYFFKKRELINSGFTEFYPAVVKAAGGRGGSEVFKVFDEKELIGVLNKINDENVVVQRLCSNPGKDLRVFVVGNKIIAAILRYSDKSFKANFSLGGKARLYELNEKEKELIHKIINKFNTGFAGIDFIFDKDNNLIFNEIEDVVGSRTLSANSDINIVRIYLEFIKDEIVRFQSPDKNKKTVR
ncbi:ATP-grasp domain-containing protein [Clostridium polynesiense]|uniref:ATP-grasp domain-containing protein n=1 Tax=Clostridium polynesiense TaxID=1325933 RepID=UPI0005908B69|nr:RimK family alpha-L-glutamate ligase [Clostridium polynesiense]